MQAQIEDAKETFTRALDLFREIRDPGGEAEVLDEMGSAIATYGEAGEALRCLEEARRSAESTGQRALLSRVLRHLANLKHEDGERDAAWDLYDKALAMAGERGRLQIFADMGHAALKEGSFDASVRYLEASLSDLAGRNRMLLSLCRLARAHKAAGRNWRAREYGVQAETLLTQTGGVPSHHGPEVYYSLGSVLEDTDRGPRYMARANELVGQRTRSIQSIVHRQHYLTMTWPNREILEEARKLL
jgi:tetratricopeptide (TPR) repeat protein